MIGIASPPSSPQLSWGQYVKQRQSDLQQLGQELESGNLSGAQSEFQDIVSLASETPSLPDGRQFLMSERQQDFDSIGQALENGNGSGALNAFDQLEATFHSSAKAETGGYSLDRDVGQ